MLECGDRDESLAANLTTLGPEATRRLSFTPTPDSADLYLDGLGAARESPHVPASRADRENAGRYGPPQFVDQEKHDADPRMLRDIVFVQVLRHPLALIEMFGQATPSDLPRLLPAGPF